MDRRKRRRSISTRSSKLSLDFLASDRTVLLLLFALVVATYANSLWNEFTYDDRPYVKENTYITSLRHLPEIFSKPYPPHDPDLSLYRPLVELSYMLDRAIGVHQTEISILAEQPEVSPIPFHVTNMLIHFFVCAVLYFLVRRFTRDRITGLIGAAIFAVHPVHVEVVASIVGRAESLCALFYLLSVWQYISWRDSLKKGAASERYLAGAFVFSTILFFAALLSKETAITLPAVLLLVDLFLLRTDAESVRHDLREASLCRRFTRLFAAYLPYIGVFLLYLTIRLLVVGEIGILDEQRYFFEKSTAKIAASMSVVFFLYLKLLLVPTILHADYNFPILLADNYFISEPESLASFWSLVGLTLLVGYLAISVILAFRKGRVAFLLLWLPITLFPVSNMIPFGDIMAERFLYLASAGYCVLVGALCAYALERLGSASPQRRKIVWIVIGVGITLLGLRSVARNIDWRDEIHFWKAALRTAPENRDVYYALGHSYADKSKEHLTLGNLARQRGDFDAASKHLEKAAQYEQRAIHYYRVSIEKHPDYYQAYYNLGILLSEAREPEHIAARKLFERGLKLYQENWQNIDAFYFGIGISYAKTKEYELAAEYLMKALRFKPRNAKYLNNLGSALASMKEYERAEALWKKALEVDPGNEDARKNLDKLFSLRRRSRSDRD